MRYVWIEDFNDESNSNTEEYLQERLENFFDLKNDKVIIKKDLSSAIEFFENANNFHEIDAILIDIRFPEGNTKDLYIKYFGDIVTKKFYQQNINDASGIMLYLILVFRYHISQKKIAFVSANVSSDNDKLKIIQEMIEIIVKSKYEPLSDEDKFNYRTIESRVGNKILKISRDKKEWDTFISKENKIEEINIDELMATIRNLPYKYHEKFEKAENIDVFSDENDLNAQMKYNHVKQQFEKIGFAMPSAFEKPKSGERKKKSYLFCEWEQELYSNTYTAVRSSVLEMCLILVAYLKEKNNREDFYIDFLNLLICNEEEKKYYDDEFFIRYLENIESIFGIECTENIDNFCERAIKEISSLWEASAIPRRAINDGEKNRSGKLEDGKYIHNDSYYFALHAVMKITRNWIGHQGIKNIKIIDVGLLFLINMRGMFDIESMPTEFVNLYKEYEAKILSLFEIDETVYDAIPESLEYFCRLNDATKVGGNNSSRRIYDKISGIGHFQSKIRREVSMDEIYMLMYHLLEPGSSQFSELLIKSVKTRTWRNWKQRYNNRFGEIVLAN